MILEVLKYGHPILRRKGDRLESITPKIRQLIADMLETMYAAKGIGLAAQQVGQAVQVMVIDLRGVTDRPSTMEVKGKAADVAAHMPLVLINPELTPAGSALTGPEGCLSFPEMYADISRAESVNVVALSERGERIEFRCSGLLARVVQHETDHLHGILFIDRMTREVKESLKPQLDELQAATKAALKKK